MNMESALSDYKEYMDRTSGSFNVRRMYYTRIETFLDACPEAAVEEDAEVLRVICERYIDSLPITTATGAGAAAVRHFWTMRTGEQFFKRRLLADFERDESIEMECKGFESYLRRLGCLKESTIVPRVRKVKLFLYTAFCGNYTREAVTAESIRYYIATEMETKTPASRGGFVTDIRSFARYLTANNCPWAEAIALLPLKTPSPKGDVKPCVSDEDFAAIVAAADTVTAKGLRDAAMALCMGNLGLRTCDVATIRLEDIDWAAGTLSVVGSKSKSDRSVPLDEATGRAIEAYVTHGRDSTLQSRRLFLPEGGETCAASLTYRQVGKSIRLLAGKAGVHGYCGAHSLRRSAASNMVANGVSVKVVADVLGHETVSTTMAYLRMDAEGLRFACSPWPKGGSL